MDLLHIPVFFSGHKQCAMRLILPDLTAAHHQYCSAAMVLQKTFGTASSSRSKDKPYCVRFSGGLNSVVWSLFTVPA